MTSETFERPVTVLAGLGMPRAVSTVFQAYSFLSESPLDRRKPSYLAAHAACLAAMNRRGDARTARDAFAVYARQVGILESDDIPLAFAGEAADIRLAG